jgi:signal transduction histidine kinase
MNSGSKLALSLTTRGRWRLVATVIVLAAGIAAAKFLVVTLLVRLQVPGILLRLQDSILTGALAAVAIWAAMRIASVRQKILAEQVETIAALNHELRNALEVILGLEYLSESTKGAAILESVQRIDRTLDQILGPKPRKSDRR